MTNELINAIIGKWVAVVVFLVAFAVTVYVTFIYEPNVPELHGITQVIFWIILALCFLNMRRKWIP
jgi:hypothetical protein